MIQIDLDQDDAMVIREYYKARYGYGSAIVDLKKLVEMNMFYCYIVAKCELERICQ